MQAPVSYSAAIFQQQVLQQQSSSNKSPAMNFVVLTVVSILVSTANCRVPPDGPDISNDVLNLADGRDLTDGHDLPNGPDDEVSTIEPVLFSEDVEDGSEGNERKLRGVSKCKSAIVCSLLGGSCVTNSTYCSGREVPSVCNGAKCKCCIPVTLEVKMHDLENEVKSMVVNLTAANFNILSDMKTLWNSIKSNITMANSNMDLKIESLTTNFNNTNSNMKHELQFIKESVSNISDHQGTIKVQFNNLTIGNSNLNTKLQNLKSSISNMNSTLVNQGCPKGTFLFTPSNQCFRVLNDTRRNWYSGKSACNALGLQLAHPNEAISLRSYLVTKYGSGNWMWINARGTGSYIRWQDNGMYIYSHNPLWWTGRPGSYTSTSYCLALMTNTGNWKSYPTTPYYNTACSSTRWTLCEYVRG